MVVDFLVVLVENSESVGSNIGVRFSLVEFNLPVLVSLDDFWGVGGGLGHVDCGEDSSS